MSRCKRTKVTTCPCFPRVSGDEPVVEGFAHGVFEFSPRERG